MAPTWTGHVSTSRWCSGDELAGALRHGEPHRWYQKVEEVKANSGLTKMSAERDDVTGGEVFSGGGVGVDGGDEIRWSSGETEASTGCAKSWRSRWWRWRGRGGGGGDAIDGGRSGGRRRRNSNSGEITRRGEE